MARAEYDSDRGPNIIYSFEIIIRSFSDFKIETDESGYEWTKMVEKPSETYRGTFALITHQLGINPHTGHSMNFTQTSIFEQYPLGYPNEDCSEETCLGTLV